MITEPIGDEVYTFEKVIQCGTSGTGQFKFQGEGGDNSIGMTIDNVIAQRVGNFWKCSFILSAIYFLMYLTKINNTNI